MTQLQVEVIFDSGEREGGRERDRDTNRLTDRLTDKQTQERKRDSREGERLKRNSVLELDFNILSTRERET